MKLSALAMPQEHGAWAFFLEASILGLCVAASTGAVWAFAGLACLFLSYQPLKFLFLQRVLSGTWDRDSRSALCIACAYLIFAAGAFFKISDKVPGLGIYFAAGLVLAAGQFYFLARKKGRSTACEILGAMTLSLPAAILPAVSGWPVHKALLVWGILGLRIIPSIFYVRALMRRRRGHSSSGRVVLAVYLFSAAGLSYLAAAHKLAWLPVLVFLFIFFYSAPKLRTLQDVNPKILGWQQAAGGLFFILSLILTRPNLLAG